MEDDTYIHIEFQTTNKGVIDLRRFKAYESLFELQMNKDIVTYVVYSGNIKNGFIGIHFLVATILFKFVLIRITKVS